jgi:hypothetical protein
MAEMVKKLDDASLKKLKALEASWAAGSIAFAFTNILLHLPLATPGFWKERNRKCLWTSDPMRGTL